MIYKLLVISVEGIESNTEINFFDGLFHHIEKLPGKAMAIGKMGKNNNSHYKFINRFEDFLLGIINKLDKNTQIFFIGDGDVEKDIEAMERAKEYAINQLLKVKLGKCSNKLIFDKGKSLDNILNEHPKIKKSKIISDKKTHKKFSNKNLFNDLIDAIDKNILTGDKMLKPVLEKIFKNSNFLEIITFIYK